MASPQASTLFQDVVSARVVLGLSSATFLGFARPGGVESSPRSHQFPEEPPFNSKDLQSLIRSVHACDEAAAVNYARAVSCALKRRPAIPLGPTQVCRLPPHASPITFALRTFMSLSGPSFVADTTHPRHFMGDRVGQRTADRSRQKCVRLLRARPGRRPRSRDTSVQRGLARPVTLSAARSRSLAWTRSGSARAAASRSGYTPPRHDRGPRRSGVRLQ